MTELKIKKLDTAFDEALHKLEFEHASLFITGRAGTGKSTLINLFRSYTKKNCVVLAPTGVAALNAGGQTIHSFCSFPPRIVRRQDIRIHKNKKLYKRIETLIIDEISMVRADLMDSINHFFQLNRDDPRPFGGLQLIFVGDLYQLPPVISNEERQYLDLHYESLYFFSAHVFEEGLTLEPFELTKVYRQEERFFLNLLEDVRYNRMDRDSLQALNEQYNPNFDEDGYITLCARRHTAQSINTKKLQLINSEERIYSAKIQGAFDQKRSPTDIILKLKVGAQVMFLKNDKEKRFVNGSLGIIEELKNDSVIVKLISEQSERTKSIELKADSWEIIKYKLNDKNEISPEVVGSFTQLPISLAWAITIHKSQGKTFHKIIIDLGRGAFDFGQTYVALSRCTKLEGIILRHKLRPTDVLADERIVDYYQRLKM